MNLVLEAMKNERKIEAMSVLWRRMQDKSGKKKNTLDLQYGASVKIAMLKQVDIVLI